MISENRQSGAALLSILLIVATLSVAALIATQAIARQTQLQKLSTRRTIAIWAERSAEAATLASIRDLVQASRIPGRPEDKAEAQSLIIPLEGGQLELDVRELPPCLNINALAHPDSRIQAQQKDALRAVLKEAGVPESDATSLIALASDWVDADHDEQNSGGESAYYLSRRGGFRAANQPMTGAGELGVLPGFTPELRRAISPFVCVIPATAPADINVNALSHENAIVLSATTRGGLSIDDVRKFIDARPAEGWASAAAARAYFAALPLGETVLDGVNISTQGDYFAGEGVVRLDSGIWHFDFLMYAGPAGRPQIVRRSFGGSP